MVSTVALGLDLLMTPKILLASTFFAPFPTINYELHSIRFFQILVPSHNIWTSTFIEKYLILNLQMKILNGLYCCVGARSFDDSKDSPRFDFFRPISHDSNFEDFSQYLNFNIYWKIFDCQLTNNNPEWSLLLRWLDLLMTPKILLASTFFAPFPTINYELHGTEQNALSELWPSSSGAVHCL